MIKYQTWCVYQFIMMCKFVIALYSFVCFIVIHNNTNQSHHSQATPSCKTTVISRVIQFYFYGDCSTTVLIYCKSNDITVHDFTVLRIVTNTRVLIKDFCTQVTNWYSNTCQDHVMNSQILYLIRWELLKVATVLLQHSKMVHFLWKFHSHAHNSWLVTVF